MLKSILKLDGVKQMNKEQKRRVKAGFGSQICVEGSACSFGSFGPVPFLPCMLGVEDEELQCVNGVWTRV